MIKLAREPLQRSGSLFKHASEPQRRSKKVFQRISESQRRSKSLFKHASEPQRRSKSLFKHASEPQRRSKSLFEHASEPQRRSKSLFKHASELQTLKIAAQATLLSHLALNIAFKEAVRRSCPLQRCSLYSVSLNSASLFFVHGYARVHTSIYIHTSLLSAQAGIIIPIKGRQIYGILDLGCYLSPQSS